MTTFPWTAPLRNTHKHTRWCLVALHHRTQLLNTWLCVALQENKGELTWERSCSLITDPIWKALNCWSEWETQDKPIVCCLVYFYSFMQMTISINITHRLTRRPFQLSFHCCPYLPSVYWEKKCHCVLLYWVHDHDLWGMALWRQSTQRRLLRVSKKLMGMH